MSQSARTIVLNLDANLHAAFDTELCRVHTAWTGTGVQLFGPPYSGSKSPFLAQPGGAIIHSFPQFCPWRFDEQFLQGRYHRLEASNTFALSYDLQLGDTRVATVREHISGASGGGDWLIQRQFAIKGSKGELRLLLCCDPEGEARVINDKTMHFSAGKMNLYVPLPPNAHWGSSRVAVDYWSEPITEEGTEKGNLKTRVQREEGALEIVFPGDGVYTVLLYSSRTNRLKAKAVTAPAAALFAGDDQNVKDGGDEFYKVEHFPLPPGAEMIITGMDWMPNGDLAVCTWLGEIFLVQNHEGPPSEARYRRIARGLNEPLGLAVLDGNFYVAQKGELTRIQFPKGEAEAVEFERVSAAWGFSGNYHSYTFGPLITPGEEMILFITGNRGRYDMPWQGWAVKISEDGSNVSPVASGLRVPHGWGTYRGDAFFTDNQGNWIGTCKLNHLQHGKFYGFPSSAPDPKPPRAASDVAPPAIWLPRSLSASASGIETITSPAFGPFEGQMLIGDFQNAIVMRAFLERINGQWQGAVFPFARGFLSGVNHLKMSRAGQLYVGGGKRTWSTAAPRDWSLDRVSWTGRTPFEVKEVHALPKGFELIFTEPVDTAEADDPQAYFVKQFSYKYHLEYGSPEFDHNGKVGATEIPITSVAVSSDGLKVTLALDGARAGFVTSFKLDLRSKNGAELRHNEFFYTLNQVPH